METIATKTRLIIDFGGGIKEEDDVNIVFNSGATLATIGSLAVKDEHKFTNWIHHYGEHKFLLGADVKQNKIAVSGWLEQTDIIVF
ncbi:HisA/HisF-related TIM barrel protein, partial [Vibrio parahaemolyticus]